MKRWRMAFFQTSYPACSAVWPGPSSFANMVFSPPFSLLAVKEGGIRWLSGPEVSLPELKPFPYNVVLVRPGYCDTETVRCQGFVAALKDAIALMKADRSASLEALGKSFDKMEPDILKASYEVFAPFAQPDMTWAICPVLKSETSTWPRSTPTLVLPASTVTLNWVPLTTAAR